MTRNDHLKIVRECEDLLVEVQKVLRIFDSSDSWHKKYNDPTLDRVDTFNHMGLDPRIIANRGQAQCRQIEEKLREAWYGLMAEVRKEELSVKPLGVS